MSTTISPKNKPTAKHEPATAPVPGQQIPVGHTPAETETHHRMKPGSELGDELPAGFTSTNIAMLIAVVFPFIGFIAVIAMSWAYGFMGWTWLSMLIGGWILTGLGITVGFHRLLTHRSFETYPWIRGLFAALGAMAIEGSPLVWTAVHRRHHEKSDHEGDPHSPYLHGKGLWNRIKGFCYAHLGWLFTSYWSSPYMEKYVPDLARDKWLQFIDKYYLLFVGASLAIPTAIGWAITGTGSGALMGLVWGGLARIFITHHITWSINSVCHTFGQKMFTTDDHSRNNAVCGLLGLGEGWHNNHHAFPTSARHGLAWWQFDLSWVVISTLKLTGLAWNIRLPSEQAMDSRRTK